MNLIHNEELYHHGTRGMHWGQRLYQNPDGTLTALGRLRYRKSDGTLTKAGKRASNRIRENYEQQRNLYKGLTRKRLTYDLNKKKTNIDEDKDPLRTKKVREMTDDELKKEITRLTNENLLKDLRNKNNPKNSTFFQTLADRSKRDLAEGISQAGKTLVNKLITTAGSKTIDDAFKQKKSSLEKLKDKAEIAKYKKQIESETAQTYNQRIQAEKNRREMEKYFKDLKEEAKAEKEAKKAAKKAAKEEDKNKNKYKLTTNFLDGYEKRHDQYGEDLVERFAYSNMDPTSITAGKKTVYKLFRK